MAPGLHSGLGLGFDEARRASGTIVIPLSGLDLSSAEAMETDAVGTQIGILLPVGGTAPYSFEITSDPSGLLQLDATSPYILEVGADLTGQTTYDFAVTVTDAKGAQATGNFTLTIVADTSSGVGGGTTTGGGSYDIDPIASDSSAGVKIAGKNGGFATLIWDRGPVSAGDIVTLTYSADFSDMNKQGTHAAVGFAFKSGDNFHLVSLRGDGVQPPAATTENDSQVYGSFSNPKSFTKTSDGAAANGTVSGPNYIQIEISGDGSSYTFRTSPDGAAWTDEYTGELPAPLANATDALEFGLGAYFTKQDQGPFVITISELTVTNASAHRYWRLYVTDNVVGTNGYVNVMELELLESEFGPNVATGGTASADANDANHPPSDAFDGLLTDTVSSVSQNMWQSGSGAFPHWLEYDFGAGNEKAIVAIGLVSERTQRCPKDFDVQYSDNGTDWTTAWSVTGATWSFDKQFRRFVDPSWTEGSYSGSPYGSHSYWGLFMQQQGGTSVSVSVAELQMRASLGGADQCSGGTATADSTHSGSSPSNAFDNDTATNWIAEDTSTSTRVIGCSVYYQFASAVEVRQFAITSRDDGASTRAPKAMVLRYSDDGSNWTTAFGNSSAETSWGTSETRTFDDPDYV